MDRRRILALVAFLGAFTLALHLTEIERLIVYRQRELLSAAVHGNVPRMKVLVFLGARANPPNDGALKPLQAASFSGSVDAVEFLLDNGADINGCEEPCTTALMAAPFSGNVDVVNLLLSRGADINAMGQSGTALDVAESRGTKEIVEVLKRAGGKHGRVVMRDSDSR